MNIISSAMEFTESVGPEVDIPKLLGINYDGPRLREFTAMYYKYDAASAISSEGIILKLVDSLYRDSKTDPLQFAFYRNKELFSKLNENMKHLIEHYCSMYGEHQDVIRQNMIHGIMDMISDMESDVAMQRDLGEQYYCIVSGELFHPITEVMKLFKVRDYELAIAYAKTIYLDADFPRDILIKSMKPKPMHYLRVYRLDPESSTINKNDS